MADKHTPGPWSASRPQEVKVKPGTHHLIIKGARNENIGLISSWRTVASEAMEAEANARLIAAAPELLDMLEEARRTLDMWKDVAPAVSLCADIDKLIAKARGDQ